MVKTVQLLKQAMFSASHHSISSWCQSYKRCKCYRLPQRGLHHSYPLVEVAYLDSLSKRAQWTTCHLERGGEFEQLGEADGAKMDVLPPTCKKVFLEGHPQMSYTKSRV